MRREKLLTFQDKLGEQLCCLLGFRTFRPQHIVAPRFQGDVVRRRTTQMLVAALDDQQVTVLDARIEMYAFRTKLLLKETYEYVAFLRLESSA